MHVQASHQSWQINDGKELRDVLAWRDRRDGAQFWLSEDLNQYPVLAITVTNEVAHVTFFPREGHAGFRCLGGRGLSKDGLTTFVFDWCDPATGEETPNEFVVPVETARSIAAEFLQTKQMSAAVSWLEL